MQRFFNLDAQQNHLGSFEKSQRQGLIPGQLRQCVCVCLRVWGSPRHRQFTKPPGDSFVQPEWRSPALEEEKGWVMGSPGTKEKRGVHLFRLASPASAAHHPQEVLGHSCRVEYPCAEGAPIW